MRRTLVGAHPDTPVGKVKSIGLIPDRDFRLRQRGIPGDVAGSMSRLPDILPVTPFTRPARGAAVIPGSKSLTNRALALAALCDEPVAITGALFSEDTSLMVDALRHLGIAVEADVPAGTLRVSRQHAAFAAGRAELFVGLAGTAARFLAALCASAPRGVYRLDGVPQMRRRPMQGLIGALRQLGADIRCLDAEGFLPVDIHARGLRGGQVRIDASESSQMLSALLMVAPRAQSQVEVSLAGGVRWPFVRMTARLMEQFGQPPVTQHGDSALTVAAPRRYALPGGVYAIEPDATAASYFMALPLVTGGELELPGLRGPGTGLQGDTRFIEVLRAVGIETFETASHAFSVRFQRGNARRGGDWNFSEFSDTFLTLAALAPLLEGPTHISGIAHTRRQETDRVAGMVRELRKLGQDVVEEEDSLAITPRPLKADATISTYGDHRFAMSFAILGCHDLRGDGRPWLSIEQPGCCAKTFPHFFELLEALRQKSLAGQS